MVELETVRQAYAAWNARDIGSLLALMDPDVEVQPLVAGVTSVAPWHGHDGVRRLVADADERWHRFEMRCDDAVAFGDRIVAFVHVTAAAGTEGVPVEGDVGHLIEFTGELVSRIVAYRDRDSAVAAAQA